MFNTETAELQFLKDSGWNTVPFSERSADQLARVFDETEKKRDSLPYDIDGIVITINQKAKQEELGEATKYPRYAIAVKFENERAVTTVTDITWQVGRTGKLTPLCHVEPVELCGAMVRKASMANTEVMENLGKINVGCQVVMERANDVIPHVYDVYEEADETVRFPEECPECGATLRRVGPNLFCTNNTDCPARVTGRIAHFVSIVDIMHLGKKTIEAISEHLNDPADLYDAELVNPSSLQRWIERMGTNAYKICDEIDKHRTITLDVFLSSLGIKMMGQSTGRQIAEHYRSLKALSEALNKRGVAALSCVDGVGDVASTEIFNGLGRNWKLIKKFMANGVTIADYSNDPQTDIDGVLDGATFVLTGTMSKKRSEIAKEIMEAGGIVQDRVNKQTEYLVCNSSSSSKLQKAQKLGTKVITEDELYEMMK